jgi:hypothetical protein
MDVHCARSLTLYSVVVLDILARIRIRTTDLRIQILLFSSVAFKDTNNNKFFWLLLFEGTVHLHHSPKIKSHKTVEIKVFLIFCIHDGRIRIRTVMTDPDGPKTYSTTLTGTYIHSF